MKETHNNKTNQGASMKKFMIVFAIAAIMMFAFASTALAKNAGSAAVSGDGYVSWTTANSIASGTAAEAAGPHANFAVSTVKCAVCHSVHGAPDNTFLLTKVTSSAGSNAGQVCAYCHGYGATAGAHIVAINQGATANSPHSSICYTTCHAGVHGTNVSQYSVLRTKLLRSGADAGITAAIADAGTGLNAGTFTQPVTGPATATQLSMATGYVCAQSGCHTSSAFAIASRGNHMATLGGRGLLSGHPVIAAASANFSVPAGTSYNTGLAGPVLSSNGVAIAALPVAFKATNGCDTCHDMVDAATTDGTAFPHNRGNSNLWMTKASDASGSDRTLVQNSDVIDSTTGTVLGLADNYTTVQDGVCLKCHVSSGGSFGVGKTF
jgi:predicted CXXCH cytochrome family protein